MHILHFLCSKAEIYTPALSELKIFPHKYSCSFSTLLSFLFSNVTVLVWVFSTLILG